MKVQRNHKDTLSVALFSLCRYSFNATIWISLQSFCVIGQVDKNNQLANEHRRKINKIFKNYLKLNFFI